jgi:hypothetical protein
MYYIIFFKMEKKGFINIIIFQSIMKRYVISL